MSFLYPIRNLPGTRVAFTLRTINVHCYRCSVEGRGGCREENVVITGVSNLNEEAVVLHDLCGHSLFVQYVRYVSHLSLSSKTTSLISSCLG